MGFNCGIVGLPNVGKSTLFNALTATQAAEAANYPFTTVEPNSGRVSVPDPRLWKIADIAKSKSIIQTQLEFEDIAGLVEGASKGEGLGNKFLGHIREVDAILHVVRCFEEDDVAHVAGSVDPIRDVELIETELMLADLESLERRREPLIKKARGQDKEAVADLAMLDRVLAVLHEGKPARTVPIKPDDLSRFRRMQLLSSKPILYVANVEEESAATGNGLSDKLEAFADASDAGTVIISAKIESEISLLDDDDRSEFLETLGLEEPGLARLIRAGYDLLGLITFFTAGPKESRAWTIPAQCRAQDAAGTIHTDFARGFIAAETIAYDDYIAFNGEHGARDAGKMRAEGRDYIVKDGDVILFRFNV
ncbi:MAG: redox-regulated ATPase YchF [Proteobacteria bacterium]|nr:redox-regulated ATPase YchF [Pseudomonadota bacterium]